MTKDEQIKLFEENERLVYLVLHNHFPYLLHDDDAVQLAHIALWKACARNYQPDLGKFTTYASKAILNELITYKRRCDRYRDVLSLDGFTQDDGTDDPIDSNVLTPAPPRPIWVGPSITEVFTERQMTILRLRKEGWTYRAIAPVVGISRTIVVKELRRIKSIINDNILYI